MNCCETLNTLSFKWPGWDKALGPKQQPQTIKQMITPTQTSHMQPYRGVTPKINGMSCCETLNALIFKWSSWD